MRAYMAWAGEPEDGAVLVFAHTSREARRLAADEVQSWTRCDYIDVRVRWLRSDCAHLREQDGPHVVDNPPSCRDCERWYTEPLDENGRCQACAENADWHDRVKPNLVRDFQFLTGWTP